MRVFTVLKSCKGPMLQFIITNSFHFTTILWKIRYSILFGHIETDFVRYLTCMDLPQESTGINSQSVKWCMILNRSVSVIGLYVISS